MKKNNYYEVSHVENPNETSVFILSLDEDEVVQHCFPPTCYSPKMPHLCIKYISPSICILFQTYC
jgi:hypothetical protein